MKKILELSILLHTFLKSFDLGGAPTPLEFQIPSVGGGGGGGMDIF